MKKLVITGGAGFLGSHLGEHFANRFQIVLYDNFTRDSLRFSPGLANNANIEIRTGDTLDNRSVRAAIDGASAVIHCAAIAGVSNYYERPVDTLRVNILGTFSLLDAMVDARVPQLVYFSTSEIYGMQAQDVREDANAISGPTSEKRWVYAVSKLAGEHATLRYGETFGIRASVVRPFNIYGPRQTGEGAISNFARHLALGQPLQVHAPGTDVRAWCYVSDLVGAVDRILECDAASGKSFNIGNPEARLTTMQLAETMIALNGAGAIEHVTQSHAPIPLRTPDITLAKTTFGYAPAVSLREGLQRTLEWFRSNPV